MTVSAARDALPLLAALLLSACAVGGVEDDGGAATPGDTATDEAGRPLPDAHRADAWPPGTDGGRRDRDGFRLPAPDAQVVFRDGAPPPRMDRGVEPCDPLPEEDCNGVDDDCDGFVDEDIGDRAPLCARQHGVCAGSRRLCGGRQGWVACDDNRLNRHDIRYTPDETGQHCDGVDNDCDGQIDEACECQPGQARDCGSAIGECRRGTQRCVDGHWADCDGVFPAREVCNQRDDDCDGRVDNDVECAADHQCLGGDCERVKWTFQPESGAFGHGVGRRERDGWCAPAGPDGEDFLLFGPYTRDIPAGPHTLIFVMLTDNVNADNNTVARLEVNDFDARAPECGNCVVASRGVRRGEFRQPFQYQEVPLPFNSPGGGHRLEFRVWFENIAYLCVERVEVRRNL